MLYMILYAICIIIRKKVIKIQYSKMGLGGGSCLFSASCWGWVTNILWHYEGVSHVFYGTGFSFPPAHPPPPPVRFDQPLGDSVSVSNDFFTRLI